MYQGSLQSMGTYCKFLLMPITYKSEIGYSKTVCHCVVELRCKNKPTKVKAHTTDLVEALKQIEAQVTLRAGWVFKQYIMQNKLTQLELQWYAVYQSSNVKISRRAA